MDIGEFLEMIWAIIIVVVSIAVSSAKKKAKERQRHFQPMTVSASPEKPVAQPAAPKASAPAPVQMQMPLPKAEPVKAEPVRPVPMQPTVHAHAAIPDCDTHDAPGSLGVASAEGMDDCHQAQMGGLERSSFAPASEQPGLTLDWSGENMVKAFIMQEVLTRPCERRRPVG